jgi:hypothetical protein
MRAGPEQAREAFAFRAHGVILSECLHATSREYFGPIRTESESEPKVRDVLTAPDPAILIEAMRDIGYSLETAVADIVDNSISAEATTIEMFAPPGDSPVLAILDDGNGMTESELLRAMHLGSRSPLEERARTDLGRFGLGMKTASFSQCRRLTVVSRKDGQTTAARWDLDHVAATHAWLVQIPDDPMLVPFSDRLNEHGTLVLWENLDRVVEHDEEGFDSGHFNTRLDEMREHLELVFHRFLSHEQGKVRVTIKLNNSEFSPHDPFMQSHDHTLADPEERIRIGDSEVIVQSFTIPHHRHLKGTQWDRAGRAGGHHKNQGFYVYRERRLILYGTWFRLAGKSELTKLSRIRVDIPNTLDAQWKIDVKKASAQPPALVRKHLARIRDEIVKTSRRVFRSRGAQQLADPERLPLWNRELDNGVIRYRINGHNPLVLRFRERLGTNDATEFARMLDAISAGFPVEALFSDYGSNPHAVDNAALPADELEYLIRTNWEYLASFDYTPETRREIITALPPCQSNLELTNATLDALEGQDESE